MKQDAYLDINIIRDEGVISVGVNIQSVCELALNLRTVHTYRAKVND
ncbi:MAG: hypothetical protein QF590_07320 [Dehalococcoidia bacterium]|nr:hypothetical protein [Dehalococcoidia bacterium]